MRSLPLQSQPRTTRATQLWAFFLVLSILFPLAQCSPMFYASTTKTALTTKGAVATKTPTQVFKETEQMAFEAVGNSVKPMKITCLTIGTRGDVQPYIALCQRLNELGHTCTIATHDIFKSWVEENGIRFAQVDGDPQDLIKHCIEHGIFSPSFWVKGYQQFNGWFDSLITSATKACQGSDLLIESPSAMVGVHIAESLQIPYFRAFTMPWTKTTTYPHAFAVTSINFGKWFNSMRWRTTRLNLKPTTFAKLQLQKIPFLYNFSPKVVPKPSDWQEWVRVTGYWFMKSKKVNAEGKVVDATLPEDLQAAINKAKSDKKKIVYIGFGSVIVPDPEKMTQTVINAVKDSNVFAIISGGWTAADKKAAGSAAEAINSMKSEIARHSSSMYYVDSVAHDILFPQIDAAVHHGGAGTTAASMRAGIPTIIKPFFGDQHFWAQRVEKLRVGTHLKSFERKELAAALKKATADQHQILAAKKLGEEIRRENGVDTAIKAIFENLSYARRLMQAQPETSWYHFPAAKKMAQALEKLQKSLFSGSKNLYSAVYTARPIPYYAYTRLTPLSADHT